MPTVSRNLRWHRVPRGFHAMRARNRRSYGARRIQRAFRARRLYGGRQRYNRTKNVLSTSIGRYGTKRTLKKRVAALEAGSSKRWDQISNTVELIQPTGTNLNTNMTSLTSLLAVQGPLCDATAGNPNMPEAEQRMNDTIFAKSVRIRGVVYGVRPLDTGGPAGSPTFDNFGQEKMAQLCTTRIWITILQDMRSSLVGPDGQSQVNPLPTVAGETALESCYETLLPGTPSPTQLTLFGPENALRSYDSSRFKIRHQECITTTKDNYRKFFDIKIKINRKLKYVQPRVATPAPPNPPAPPYNYNLVTVFTCNNPSVPIEWATFLSSPQVLQKTTRLYFIDA